MEEFTAQAPTVTNPIKRERDLLDSKSTLFMVRENDSSLRFLTDSELFAIMSDDNLQKVTPIFHYMGDIENLNDFNDVYLNYMESSNHFYVTKFHTEEGYKYKKEKYDTLLNESFDTENSSHSSSIKVGWVKYIHPSWLDCARDVVSCKLFNDIQEQFPDGESILFYETTKSFNKTDEYKTCNKFTFIEQMPWLLSLSKLTNVKVFSKEDSILPNPVDTYGFKTLNLDLKAPTEMLALFQFKGLEGNLNELIKVKTQDIHNYFERHRNSLDELVLTHLFDIENDYTTLDFNSLLPYSLADFNKVIKIAVGIFTDHVVNYLLD